MKKIIYFSVSILALLVISSCENIDTIGKILKENKYWVVSSVVSNETGIVYAHKMYHFENKIMYVYEEKERGGGFEMWPDYLDSKGRSLEDCYIEILREPYSIDVGMGSDGGIMSETLLFGDLFIEDNEKYDVCLRYTALSGSGLWYGFKEVR